MCAPSCASCESCGLCVRCEPGGCGAFCEPIALTDRSVCAGCATSVGCALTARSGVRLYLDTANDGIKLRQVDGSAQEYLWGLNGNPGVYLEGQNYTYVYESLKGLVHATLKDAHGYVEGVRGPLVEGFIDAHPFTHELLIPTAAKQAQQAPAS